MMSSTEIVTSITCYFSNKIDNLVKLNDFAK